MNIRQLIFLTLLLPVAATADDSTAEMEAIAEVLDGFHDAAAHGDNDRYLGYMTEDAVFMGTDEWERWPKQPDFIDYVGGRFKDGAGWDYRSVERQIRIADSGDTAWFDEVLYSEPNGRFRGTGVLVRTNGNWKIAHYAMSFLILNENWTEVIDLTRKTRISKAPSQTPE
jgi:ketosteroid isomerase-like protein